jgi:hypothetical protein
MVEVPAESPVTIPVAEVTVATPAFALDQVPPLVVEVSVEVKPTQTVVAPEMVPATGAAVTVIVLLATALGQPPTPAIV